MSETVPAFGERVVDQTKAVALTVRTKSNTDPSNNVSDMDKAQEEEESKVRGGRVEVIGGAL